MKIGAEFAGRVMLPETDGFDLACRMYNGAIVESPQAIFYCTSEADVEIVVRAAVRSDTKIVVRSTGHSVSGRSMATNAAVIDLSPMRAVKKLAGRIMAADGGATWWDFDTKSSFYGLAVTGGTVSTTGVAGLTLGGGIGWLLPTAGLACDSLRAARLVTADGSAIYVSDDTDPELMRCLRGLGHGLGVVTQLEFEALPLRRLVAGSISLDPTQLSNARVDHICEILNHPSPSQMVSPSLICRDGRAILSIDLALYDPSTADIRLVESLANGMDVLDNTVRDRDYISLQTMLDTPSRAGLRAHWRPSYLHTIEPTLLRVLIDRFMMAPSAESIIFLEHYHGAFLNPVRASAFPGRHSRFAVLLTASWQHKMDDSKNIRWLDETTRAVDRWTAGELPYINYVSDLSPGPGRQWPLLYRDIKRRLDPGRLFVDALPPAQGAVVR